jgi:hypothetical protein
MANTWGELDLERRTMGPEQNDANCCAYWFWIKYFTRAG